MPSTRWRRPLIVLVLSAVGLGAGAADLRLVDAAKKGDKAAVRALLKQGVDVKARQGDGATALHWAAYWDDRELADLLIRAGAPVNAENELGATPVWVACSQANVATVRTLLAAGANPNVALESGETPLMSAARTGSVDVVNALLAKGADPNAKEHSRGQTALMWAVAERHAAVVQLLVDAGASMKARSDVYPMTVNFGGAGNNSLTSNNPPDPRVVDHGGYSALLFAARDGDVASAAILLKAGADPNDTPPAGTSALVVAAHSGNGEVAQLLLEKGADPNAAKAGYTALHMAVVTKNLPLVKALLAHGADANLPVVVNTHTRRTSQDVNLDKFQIKATPYWLAAQALETDIMRALAAHGADTAFVKDDGRTAIMTALQASPPQVAGRPRGDDGGEHERHILETVRLAAELGADVNAADPSGNTALHIAATSRLTTIIPLLVEKGAKLDSKNKKGQTPLAAATAAAARTNPSAPTPTPEAGAAARGPGAVEVLKQLGARE